MITGSRLVGQSFRLILPLPLPLLGRTKIVFQGHESLDIDIGDNVVRQQGQSGVAQTGLEVGDQMWPDTCQGNWRYTYVCIKAIPTIQVKTIVGVLEWY